MASSPRFTTQASTAQKDRTVAHWTLTHPPLPAPPPFLYTHSLVNLLVRELRTAIAIPIHCLLQRISFQPQNIIIMIPETCAIPLTDSDGQLPIIRWVKQLNARKSSHTQGIMSPCAIICINVPFFASIIEVKHCRLLYSMQFLSLVFILRLKVDLSTGALWEFQKRTSGSRQGAISGNDVPYGTQHATSSLSRPLM